MQEVRQEKRDPVWGLDGKCLECAAELANRIDGEYVEGIVVGGMPQRQILHAWVEKDGNVYDATNNLAMSKAGYNKIFSAEELYRESGAKALARGSDTFVSKPAGWVKSGDFLVPPDVAKAKKGGKKIATPAAPEAAEPKKGDQIPPRISDAVELPEEVKREAAKKAAPFKKKVQEVED